MKKNAWAGLALVAGFVLFSNASAAHAEMGTNVGVRADAKADIKADARDFRGEVKDMRDDFRQDVVMKIDGALAEIGVHGIVTAKSGTTLTVSGKPFGIRSTSTATTTYTVDASDAKVRTEGERNDDASLSDISVGDTVHVTGKIDGTSVDANMVLEGNVMFKGRGDMHASSTWASTSDAWKPRGFFSRIGHFFRGLFGGKGDAKADMRFEVSAER